MPSPPATIAPQAATLGNSSTGRTGLRRRRKAASVTARMLLCGALTMHGRVANTDQGADRRAASGSSRRHTSTKASSSRCW